MIRKAVIGAAAVIAGWAGVFGTILPARSDQIGAFEVAAASGRAPEFRGIAHWLNSGPLTLSQLRGKVVLVDFWTYGCYNCVNTLPYVTKLQRKYGGQGFTVIGVHTPEFPYEKSTANVEAAIRKHGIRICSRPRTGSCQKAPSRWCRK